MKTIILAIAAAGSALAFATPAAAQYGAPYGNAYGYQGYQNARSLQVRLRNVERQIARLDRRDNIRDGHADRLRREANQIENRLQRAMRYGLNGYEANDINVRIARLEQRVQYSVASRYGSNYNRAWSDRDRDGRNDRFEDDRGYRHD